MATSKKPVVAFCQPVAHKIDPLSRRSERLLDRSMVADWHSFDMNGFPVEVARNELTHSVVNWETPEDRQPITHLFWVDDDMVYAPNTLARLLALDLPFVGGLCFDRRHPYKPVISRFFDPSWGFEPNTVGWLFDYPPDEVIDVDATGGAFLLVKMEVFKAIRAREVEEQVQRDAPGLCEGLAPPGANEKRIEEHRQGLLKAYRSWWTPLAWQGASEDFSFCYRAREAGYKLKVDTGCKIGHVGEVVVDEAFAKRNRTFTYRDWHPPLDALLDAARTGPATQASQGLRDLDAGTAQPAPLASVVIPVYNQKPEHLLAAVKSALAQTVPVEVIVVDDGSTPAVWMKNPRGDGVMITDNHPLPDPDGIVLDHHPHLRVLRHVENMGIAAALNTGIATMTTDWFAWLSSDDLYDPRKIEHHLSALLAAKARCGYTGYNLLFDNQNLVGHVVAPLFSTPEDARRVLGQVCAINGSTVMIHREVFAAVGRFAEDFRYGQDWEFWCRAAERFFWHGIPDKLTTRREFGNLTERLNREQDPAKTKRRNEEDRMIRERYSPVRRATVAVEQAREVCAEAGHAAVAPCAKCLAGIVARAF